MTRQLSRPLWLITLADLALLLLGFFVLVQATQRQDAPTRAALAAGIRDAFGGAAAEEQDGPGIAVAHAGMAVDANIVDGFASGSAEPGATGPLRRWAAEAAADPRTVLLITGHADGSTADRRDGSALALASARAAAVAAALEGAIAPERLTIAAALAPEPARGRAAGRRVTVTIAFAPPASTPSAGGTR
ncbi:flagellar motor protein MotB [Sphingomonas flavalba]|uniref:flagellar motor protein MotB n=1 Tax=Sphingomonas flavalba TaxID=2559804 RepID=UPI0039DFFC44